MKEFYITDKDGNYIEDIDEAINNSLEEIKNFYQFCKVRTFKYKITAKYDYKKRTKEEVKITKIFFYTDYIINNAIYDYGDFKQRLDYEKELYESYVYDFEFLGLRSILISIEPIKASIGSYIELPPDLKNSKSILIIRNSKYNCLQLTITAWLHPAIKNFYQFCKLRTFKYKITAKYDHKKRTKEEVKTTKIFFNTDYIINNAIYDYGDFKQRLDYEKELYESYVYDFEFLGLRSILISIEPIKASIGSYIELPPDLKNSKSILIIRNSKYNCLQLTITAWLHPAMDYATRESKNQNKLIAPRQQHEDDFGYKLRIQKLYNINIWIYKPCGDGKVELLKQVDDFDKDRKDDRILVGKKAREEHCALIKNIETLLDRPNKNNIKYYHCDRCKYLFNSQIKYDNLICSHSCKPEIVCPKKKHITFLNEHKRQNTKKNIITADIECCIVEVASNDYKYVKAERIPISIGYIWQGSFKYYFDLDCIKRFARDLLEIETETNFKLNKPMIFNKEDELYHETNNTCHICSKTCINEVRDHCHETDNYRGPACRMCNLRYKQQNFIPVIFHNGSGYEFNLLYIELFKQKNDKRKVDNLQLAAGKSKMFSIVCLKFLDSYIFLAMPLDQMAMIYHYKTKTLYSYEYFGLDSLGTTTKSYSDVIANLNIEDFKTSLSKKLPTQEEVDNFNKDNSLKTGKDQL